MRELRELQQAQLAQLAQLALQQRDETSGADVVQRRRLSVCLNHFEGDTLGTPPDSASIMASTGYCQNDPFLSRWDLVGIRAAYGTRPENVLTVGSTLYARKTANADIYKKSGSTWTKVGGPGSQFLGIGSTLYGLGVDAKKVVESTKDIYRYTTGTTWIKEGQP